MDLRILFVEKDVTTADLLVPSLERKGYQVVVARTQRQALSCIRSHHPNILVVDVASFGTNGYRISDTIRAQMEAAPTILLLEKGHIGAGDVNAFMMPPFTSRKLLFRIRKVSEKLEDQVMHAGPIRFDPDTQILRCGGQAHRLRPKEAALLTFFMRNPEKVLSRQEIMKQVWETDYVGDTRTVSVHVRWLRLKIEEDPSRPRILRTVRGIGYRFEVATCQAV
jgi:DNA-binding response OmpR family regulator